MSELTSEIAELVSAIVLDAEIAAIATAESIALVQHLQSDRLPALSIARAEAWRQLRARNVFPYDERLVASGSDPVSALTVIERTALALVGRLHLEMHEAAQVMGLKTKQFEKTLRKSKIQLVRATTAITLITMESRCPAVVSGKHRFGTALDRKHAMHFVVHAGECSICVPVLRQIDKTVWQEYQSAPAIEADVSSSVFDVDALISRAKLKDGWATPLVADFRDQNRIIKRAVWIGAASSVLLGLSWLLS